MHGDEEARDAWLAFENGRLEDAERLWSELIATAANDELRDRYIGHRAYVLVAQARFEEARAAYRGLLERRPSHRHLHQLGMVEREAGNLAEALDIFDREAAQLPDGDVLALAANLYERALIHHLLREQVVSLQLMEQCVAAATVCGDATMVGVAYRLKGDLLAGDDPSRARAAYQKALADFVQAEDEFGAAELERRIASLPGAPEPP